MASRFSHRWRLAIAAVLSVVSVGILVGASLASVTAINLNDAGGKGSPTAPAPNWEMRGGALDIDTGHGVERRKIWRIDDFDIDKGKKTCVGTLRFTDGLVGNLDLSGYTHGLTPYINGGKLTLSDGRVFYVCGEAKVDYEGGISTPLTRIHTANGPVPTTGGNVWLDLNNNQPEPEPTFTKATVTNNFFPKGGDSWVSWTNPLTGERLSAGSGGSSVLVSGGANGALTLQDFMVSWYPSPDGREASDGIVITPQYGNSDVVVFGTKYTIQAGQTQIVFKDETLIIEVSRAAGDKNAMHSLNVRGS